VQPDLVVSYSNMQSELSKDLISAGIEVHAFNQRSVAGILHMIKVLGQITGKSEQAAQLVSGLQQKLSATQSKTDAAAVAGLPLPSVYFEEWDSPMMSCIGWVSELISIAGGKDAFADLAQFHSARERIIEFDHQVVERAPDIIIASWCGKKFRPEKSQNVQAGAKWLHLKISRCSK